MGVKSRACVRRAVANFDLRFAVIRCTVFPKLPPTARLRTQMQETPLRTCRWLFVLLAVVCSVGRAQAQQTISCSSDDMNRHYCNAETRAGVQLVKQRSGSPCTQGYSWDYDDRGIWVDHGCRADFLLSGNAGPIGGQTVTCSSNDGRRNHCNADTHNGVQMTRQISGSPCTEGQTWGFDQSGIWVDRGCRAEFAVETGGRYGNGYGNANGYDDDAAQGRTCTQAVGAQRANQLAQQCLQVSPATYPSCNAQNTCKLITDEIKRSCKILGYNAPGFCDEYR
jgi:hypothetical protein